MFNMLHRYEVRFFLAKSFIIDTKIIPDPPFSLNFSLIFPHLLMSGRINFEKKQARDE